MSDEAPKNNRRRKRSPYTTTVDTVLVQFTAELIPHDSPEFQERARQARQRPIPDYLKNKPKPDQEPPADSSK